MNAPHPEPKVRRVMSFLASGRSLHRFLAEEAVHDHCLPSTISEIEFRFGLQVDRSPAKVRGFAGVPTRVTKYRLATQEQRDQARAILGKKKPDAGTPGLDVD